MIYGQVKKAYIIKDHKKVKSRGNSFFKIFKFIFKKGFGFVEFSTVEEATRACQNKNHKLNGFLLTCTAFKDEDGQIGNGFMQNKNQPQSGTSMNSL